MKISKNIKSKVICTKEYSQLFLLNLNNNINFSINRSAIFQAITVNAELEKLANENIENSLSDLKLLIKINTN